jgi:transposase
MPLNLPSITVTDFEEKDTHDYYVYAILPINWITNVFTESVNNLIESIARQGRGYSFDVLRARLLSTKEKH